MIETERKDSVLTVKVKGRVDGSNANDFQNQIKDSVTAKDKVVMLDMGQLTYISSAGLRVVLMVAKSLEQRSAKFMLYGLSDSIKEVFAISGFDKVIKVCSTRKDALAAAKKK